MPAISLITSQGSEIEGAIANTPVTSDIPKKTGSLREKVRLSVRFRVWSEINPTQTPPRNPAIAGMADALAASEIEKP